MTKESQRLEQSGNPATPWKKWGPYLSERQWGTVREDCSENGDAWNDFTHDQARSRAYRWGEDGIAGISDDKQRLCFALALWNGRDPILKERLFGLTNSEGNHGEDVKEYYFYLDATPTHSYLKQLYKYPHSAFPYVDLVETNRGRSRQESEYELLDTGVFDEDRYFDVFVEYAKAAPEDILIQITVHNRGPEVAEIDVLPTLWFRNRWSRNGSYQRPELRAIKGGIAATEPLLGKRYLYCEGAPELLFTENETNQRRLFGRENPTPFVKDGIHEFIVGGRTDTVNPAKSGTKAAAHYHLAIPPGESATVRLRLTDAAAGKFFGGAFDKLMKSRRQEADEFYAGVIPESLDADAALVMRQALAGMIWTKQYYYFDVNRWLEERGHGAFQGGHKVPSRNDQWHHLYCCDIISMPDKWEYPWFAAWDLAFHVLPLSLVDSAFGKQQLELMLSDTYLHPNGQIPAYEWNFSDVNPPVHAWATNFSYQLEKVRTGKSDTVWLERCFQKLLLNFTWWLNRKDRMGRNAFEGGFLGLDNIGVFDRSAPLPTGGHLEQADGTAWMALFSLNMLEMSTELARHNIAYADMSIKFTQHFVAIASATIHTGGGTGMWDEEDGFFYDVLQHPDGRAERIKVRSMVGLLPLCAVTVFDGGFSQQFPDHVKRLEGYLTARPELVKFIHNPSVTGHAGRHLTAILNEANLRRVLAKMLDENEFLSPHGLRSLSRIHADHPYEFRAGNATHRVTYLPAESDSGMFGGNSNWRGPVWIPLNALMVRALLQYYSYYGNEFTVECPTGSGRLMTLYQVAEEINRRIAGIFLKGPDGRRPVNGGTEKFQTDPHWKDCIQFYEYFHGDNGAGLGASHQTGWTGIIARAVHLFQNISSDEVLERGKSVLSGLKS